MKKLVIINFDDQYINTSKIVCNAFNEIFVDGEDLVCLNDIEFEINKPFQLLVNNIIDEYSNISFDEAKMSKLITAFDENIIDCAILSNGIQEFLHECSYFGIEVRIITNKPLKSVEKCVNHFTKNLVSGIDVYKEEYDGIKLIERLVEERKLSFKDVLIISGTDFNDEFLKYYEYSKQYSGDNIFQDYTELIDVLHDEEILFPFI